MQRLHALGGGALAAVTLAAALVAQGGGTQRPAPADSAAFVAHPEHIQPGLVAPRGAALVNPYAGDPRAVAEGERLYVAYNCIDCHGAGGGGAMGPSLADGRWHFGGSAGAIYESIYQGRPEGMPAWGSLIARDQIWRLVAYLESLRPAGDVTTENFTGRTVERTGH
jgi:cytochrome c oxidase cbb3-type subunit III